MKAELLIDIRAKLGEGPLWDEQTQRLYWVDIFSKILYRYNPATGRNERFELDQMASTVVLRQNGGLLLGVENGIAAYDPSAGQLDIWAEPEIDLPNNRFNDGKCDPAGRFWIGSMHRSATGRDGSLYRFDPDRSLHKMIGQVSISNGIVWSADHAAMYYIDTGRREIQAFDYDIDGGSISNGRAVVDVADDHGSADGMAIDIDGHLWVAYYGGWCVRCWNPHTGRELHRIELPTSNVTACAFGGPELQDLYITTAGGDDAEKLKREPLAGSLFICRPGVTGRLSDRFAG